MNTKKLLLCIACMLTPATAFAHDAKLHKGTPVEGEIIEREAKGFTLQSKDGTHKVTFKKRPNIEVGSATHAEPDDLKAGQHVSVFGTKLPGGEIAADEVLVHEGDDHDHSHGAHHDSSHNR